jgi:pyruvate/2-oxoglutarate dehydrogenase complex dihydrolipoamide dehydrogenase (E3) component
MSSSPDYDVAVIGGGAAGLTASGFCANFGAKTLMVERDRLGGDCTWTGCIPSKALLRAAHAAHEVRHADRFGLSASEPGVDFQQVMEIVRERRRTVYHDVDRPEIYEGFGVDVVTGEARFTGEQEIEVTTGGETRRITAKHFIVATGGRPAVPPIPGLDAVPYLTNETLFELEAQPKRLAILGGGPIGVEMAQAFRRLGSEVTVIDRADRILSRDDPDHARILQEVLEDEGVQFRLEASVERVAQPGNRDIEVYLEDEEKPLVCDALLVATGRRPNVEALNLKAARVRGTEKGITTDEHGRTSNKQIYAVGDVSGDFQLTHMSEHTARIAAQNIVLKVPASIDGEHLPWCTFTSPELAHLGASEEHLREKGEDYEVYRFPYAKVDRALAEGDTTGEIKVFAKKWTGTILGASVVGERAGELISLYAVAMKGGVSLRQIADTIHPYPTYGLAARRAADQWYARKQYPVIVDGLKKLFGLRGETPPPPDPDRIV